ncbi:unnamed protein product [Urochloa decumbens]|uniref:F-box domain-containing protein n=1 Tax=Urochloa decumbens TaxID=240449 RepID=A0ABC9C4A8_9POAL
MASSPNPKNPRSPASASPAARDWASLPPDILISVFLVLGPYDIMRGADRTCTAWRRVAVDDPDLWRRIDMGDVLPCSAGGRVVVSAAMDRAAGQCESFSGPCDNHLLFLLVERAPLLKILHLTHLYAPNKVLTLVLNRLPLLEDLEISLSYVSTPSENLLQSICQDCPRLKKLRLNCSESYDHNGSGVAMEIIRGKITLMRELQSLELFHCDLTVQGLGAILDSCPMLETLRITGFMCGGGKMDEKLRQKCVGVKNLTLPDKSVNSYRRHPMRHRMRLRMRTVHRRDFGPWDWQIDG